MAKRLLFIACMVATWAAVIHGARYELDSPSPSPSPSTSPSPSPSPSDDNCSALIYGMASCFPFLINGNNETKPDSACCSGFESVMKVNPECICDAIKSSGDLGVDLNMTKAMTLPSACGVSAAPISQCAVAPPAPVKPPVFPPTKSPAPSPPESPAAVPSDDDPGSPAPAPSPLSNGGAYSTSASFTVAVITMLVALLSILSV